MVCDNIKRAIDFVRTKSRCSQAACRQPANSGSLGAPRPLKHEEERLLKETEQKQKKKYKRKGHRKEVLFKDDEWEIVKAKAANMNLSTTRYIVKVLS